MKELFASVSFEGKKSIKKGLYKTKKEFKEDLTGNGYKVNKIYTKKQLFALNFVTFEKDVFNKSILENTLKEYGHLMD